MTFAFVIALINEGNKVRILDLSNGASIRIFDYDYADVVKAVAENRIQLYGVGVKGLELTYFGDYLYNHVPNIAKAKSTSNKATLIMISYSPDGNNIGVVCNCKGKMDKIPLNDLNKYPIKNILNIKTEVEGNFKNYPLIRNNIDSTYGEMVNNPDNSPFLPINLSSIPSSSIDNLDHWVTDEEFKEYCLINRIKYSSEGAIFHGVHKIGRDLIIPSGYYYIHGFSYNDLTDGSQLEYVHLPDTIFEVALYGFEKSENYPHFRGFKFQHQDSNEERSFYILSTEKFIELANKNSIGIHELYPDNIIKLSNFGRLNISDTSKIDITGKLARTSMDLSGFKKLKEVESSYNCVSLYGVDSNRFILPDTVKQYLGSFDGVSISGYDVMYASIGNAVEEIRRSFSIWVQAYDVVENTPLEVDFSNAISLKTISDNSFCGINNRVLDLSNCKELKEIGEQCFCQCPNLEQIIFPETLERIYHDAFKNCPKLSKVTLPKRCRSVGFSAFDFCNNLISIECYGDTQICSHFAGCPKITVEFKGITEIRSNMFSDLTAGDVTVILPDNIETCYYNGFYNCKLNKIRMDNLSITELKGDTFNHADGKTLDMYNWDTKVIPGGTFAECMVEKVALPKGTIEIGDEAFRKCKIQRLFVPGNSIKFDKAALRKINADVKVEVFTRKGSETEKVFKKAGCTVMTFDTDEEAYETCLGLNTQSSKKQQAKSIMLLNNSEDPVIQEILQPENINYVDTLMRVYKKTKQDTVDLSNIPNIKIDTSKLELIMEFTDLIKLFNNSGMNGLDTFKDVANNWYNEYKISFDFSPCTSPDLLTNSFKAVSNLVTWGSDQSLLLKSKPAVEKFYKTIVDSKDTSLEKVECLSLDEHGLIFALIFRSYRNGSNVKFSITNIVLGKYVVYMTLNDSEPNYSSVLAATLGKHREYSCYAGLDGTHFYNITELFGTNDKMSFNYSYIARVNGANLTKTLNRKVMKESQDQCMPFILHRNTNGNGYLICLRNWDIITANLNYNSSTQSINSIHEASILDVKNMNDLTDKEKTRLTSLLFGKGLDDFLRGYYYRDEEIRRMTKSEDAYDEKSPTIEWELSRQLQQAEIKEFEKLNAKSMKIILSTSFFAKVRKPLNELMRGSSYSIKLADGSELVTKSLNKKRVSFQSIVGIQPYYLSYLIPANESLTDMVDCYVHSWAIGKINKAFVSLYDSNRGKHTYLEDAVWDSNDFVVYDTTTSYSGIAACLIICQATGESYLACQMASRNYNFVPILRFKSLKNALEFMKVLYVGAYRENGNEKVILDRFLACGRLILEGYHNSTLNDIYKLRQVIMEGYPNGFEFGQTSGYNLFEMCAKQKKEQMSISE